MLILPAALGVSKQEAKSALESAENDIDQVRNEGYPINAFNDLLNLAKESFERAEFSEIIRQSNSSDEIIIRATNALEGIEYNGFRYDDVLEYTSRISERKAEVFLIDDQLRAMELKILQNSKNDRISTVEAEKFYESARENFWQERFVESKTAISKAHESIDSQRASLAQEGILEQAQRSLFREYATITGLVTFIVVIIGLIGWYVFSRRKLTQRLDRLLREKKSLHEMFEKTQLDRYKKGAISHHQYRLRMKKYHSRLAKLRAEIRIIESRLGVKFKQKTVLVIGSFQPLHNGHLKVINDLSAAYEEIIIAVLVNRGSREKNPLTYEERKQMINEVLASQDILNYSIYPFPEQTSYLDYAEYVRRMLPAFDLVVSSDSELINIFKSAGFKTSQNKGHVTWGSDEVLNELLSGDINPAHVPRAAITYLQRNGILERVSRDNN